MKTAYKVSHRLFNVLCNILRELSITTYNSIIFIPQPTSHLPIPHITTKMVRSLTWSRIMYRIRTLTTVIPSHQVPVRIDCWQVPVGRACRQEVRSVPTNCLTTPVLICTRNTNNGEMVGLFLYFLLVYVLYYLFIFIWEGMGGGG